MKKSRIVGYALTLAATLMVGSAMGQVRDANYSKYDGAAAAPDNLEYVTSGTTTGLFVEPDKAFHPSYNAGGSWATTTGFSWDWTIPAAAGAKVSPASLSYPNYVEIKWGNTPNTYTIAVKEVAPAAFGGCSAADQTIDVKVIAAPVITITTSDNDGTNQCGNKAFVNVGLKVTEDVPNSLASYYFNYRVKVETIDGAGNVLNDLTATKGDETKWATLFKINSGITTTGTDHTFSIATPALDVQIDPTTTKPARTRYTFELKPASLSSAITRKGDYITNSGKDDALWTGFALGGAKTSVSFIVNPTPVTGPIYRVANNWAK